MSSDRIKKVNALIRDEIAKIISAEMDFDGFFVTVVSADVSRTLEHANIRISVFPEHQAAHALKLLNKNIYHLQQILNKQVVMRPVPKIRFVLDATEERAENIEKLLSQK